MKLDLDAGTRRGRRRIDQVCLILLSTDATDPINPRLNDYLAESPPGRIGIIVMDYFEEPRELVSNVIKANVTTGVTGTPGR